MFYAGIGSRKCPPEILFLMTASAEKLAQRGYTLRSGGASGADSAFEAGATRKEIYLPWRGFNSNESHLCTIDPLAYAMAERYHPAWNRCSPAARKFHARNCYQVLGKDLATPADFVMCWTPRGEHVGGTGQALRIADDYSVPIINMFRNTWRTETLDLLNRLHDERVGEYEQQQDAANERYIAEHFGDSGRPI